MPLGIPVDPMMDAFGEDITIFSEGSSRETQGILLRNVLLLDGDLQYYGTALDLPADDPISPGDYVTAGSDRYEVTRTYRGDDPNWKRFILAARRGGV